MCRSVFDSDEQLPPHEFFHKDHAIMNSVSGMGFHCVLFLGVSNFFVRTVVSLVYYVAVFSLC